MGMQYGEHLNFGKTLLTVLQNVLLAARIVQSSSPVRQQPGSNTSLLRISATVQRDCTATISDVDSKDTSNGAAPFRRDEETVKWRPHYRIILPLRYIRTMKVDRRNRQVIDSGYILTLICKNAEEVVTGGTFFKLETMGMTQ